MSDIVNMRKMGRQLIWYRELKGKLSVEIERNRIRITIFHGEDEEIIKLNLEEAEELAEELETGT